MSLMKKTILITGVSRGLGRALTDEFIRLGHVVLGCGRSAKEIAALQKQFPAPNDFSIVDVADDAQVAAWAKKVLAAGLVAQASCLCDSEDKKEKHTGKMPVPLCAAPDLL